MNRMRLSRISVVQLIALVIATLVLGGCTSVAEIRTRHEASNELIEVDAEHPSAGCSANSSTAPARAHSIEDYKDSWAGFVEFDDEGWLYEPHGQPTQIQVVQKKLKDELNDPRYDNTDFLVVAFVHGWHHNAHDTDCNVREFRAMLKVANTRYAAEAAKDSTMLRRRIIGVYAGWRGESIDIDRINVSTVLDRRNAAERVAKGDVRELFAQLRRLQIGESQKRDSAGRAMRADRMRTVVIGHSFGGLIAFHGLSPAVLNELALTKPEVDQGCLPTVYRAPAVQLQNGVRVAKVEAAASTKDKTAPVFPDMLVLINPAFEGTRFESLHALMRPSGGCIYPEDRPKVVVVTADNDQATGAIFHAGRKLLTLLEAYPREGDSDAKVSRERDANTHAIGFTQAYPTHRLCVIGEGASKRAVAALTPPLAAQWKLDPFAPVWVVRAPPRIVDGHNGFFFAKPELGSTKQEPYLLNWLVDLHLLGPGPGSSAMTADDACPPPAP